MKLRGKFRERLLTPLLGLLFALFATPVLTAPASALTTPVSEPETISANSSSLNALKSSANLTTSLKNSLTILADETDELSDEEDGGENKTSEENKDTCYDVVKGISWLVCPTSGVIAQAVDAIYSVIHELLVVQPVSQEDGSPVYIVWQSMRDITNIVFVIVMLIVIYSQLTGIGFDNYSIKKILPKLIITAVLINLSFLICSVAVDASNLLGGGLRGIFESLEQTITENAYFGDAPLVSWEALAGILLGGGAVAGIAISVLSVPGFLWMLVPSLVAALLAIVTGLITIAMRQAVVALLVMIAPLAFVAYLLPNTESWFKKWKDTFISMLVFFPMFSLLFGASHLAGWALIAKASQDGSAFMLILGMAVQVIPLFLSVSLMRMSGTVLGKVNDALRKTSDRINDRVAPWARDHSDTARARRLAEASTRNFNPLSGASYAAWLNRQKALRASDRAVNEARVKGAAAIHDSARKSGRKVIGWGKDGRPIYSRQTKANRYMQSDYNRRSVELAAASEQLHLDNSLGDIESYMRANGFVDDRLKAAAAGQAQNYLRYRTQLSAKARNDRADNRFYFEEVKKAMERDDVGRITRIKDYNRLIRDAAGADAFSESETTRQNALTTVTADAYSAFEKEREENSKRYGVLFDKQVTKDVFAQYKSAYSAMNIDAVVAAQNVLAKRGDYDKVGKVTLDFLDQTGDFANLGENKRMRLATDFSNVLASNLLGMKDADPFLGRLGKAINMETWRYTSGKRDTAVFTAADYIYGDRNDAHSREVTSAAYLAQGTGLGKIDRTFVGDVQDTYARFGGLDGDEYHAYVNSMMPAIISAMPTYESGGEQILKMNNLLTGLTKEKGRWTADYRKDENGNRYLAQHVQTGFIETYIKGLTDKDINLFKTDTIEAVCEAIAQTKTDKNGNPLTCYQWDDKKQAYEFKTIPQEVIDQLREWANDDVLDIIQNNVNSGTNTGTKPKVLKAFGIKSPNL